MKCLSCDCILSNREATRKSGVTGEFIDLCDDCFQTIQEDVFVQPESCQIEEEQEDESISD